MEVINLTREQMIYQCRQKLPYPISWYDKINDGALYNVWHKHVELGIPIDKRKNKYRALNDIDRMNEQNYKQMTLFDYQKQLEQKDEPISAHEYARRCLNRGEINFITIHIYGEDICHKIVDNELTVEEYYDIIHGSSKVEQPIVIYNEDDGCYYRRTDACGYTIMTDEEVEDLCCDEQNLVRKLGK